MDNPLRPYLYEIGSALGKLGYELCQQAQKPYQPLNFHGEVSDAISNVVSNLHNLSADLDAWRKEMLAQNGKIELPKIFEGTDGADVESAYWAVNHLIGASAYDVDSGKALSFIEELRKLEWLFEELQNTPEPIRNNKASYEDFSFDKITGNR